MKINNFARLSKFLTAATFLFLLSSHNAYTQDLSNELDALDDLPEEDLFGGSGGGTGSSSSGGGTGASKGSASAKKSGVEDELSFDEDLMASGKKSDARSSNSKGVGDPDLEGLEQELKFDDYQDGNALSLDQLNDDPSLKGSTIDSPLGTMSGLDFKQLGDRVRLIVSANRPIDWTRELRGKRRQVVVELRNMKIGNALLKRPLDTGEFEGPVALIQAFDSSSANIPTVKVLIQLRNFIDPTILRTGNQLVVDFPLVTSDSLFRSSTAKARAVTPKTFLSMADIKEFKGNKITLSAKEAALADVVKLILGPLGINYFFKDDSRNAQVTVNLTNLPWDQALATVLFNLNPPVGYQVIDNVYYLSTRANLTAELEALTRAQTQSQALAPLETRLIPVAYYALGEMQTRLAPFSTPQRGTIVTDAPSSTLIVTDTAEALEKMERLVKVLDKQPAQILIEGRIVSIEKNYSRELGIGWNVGPITTSKLSSNIAVGQGAPTAAVTQAAAGPGQLFVPFRVGTLGNFGAVSAQLTLSSGTDRLVRNLSSPRIVTQNGLAGSITDQTLVERRAGTNNAGNNAFQDITVPSGLTVTPVVRADGFLDLTINFSQASSTGTTRAINSRVLVEDGKTVVLGGIVSDREINEKNAVPFFSALPIFGRLFATSSNFSIGNSEVMAFISPKILNPNESRGYAWDGLQKARRGEAKQGDALSIFGSGEDEGSTSDTGTF